MMSKEKRRVPKLRFPGFTEDWEQRKLGSLATVEMNKRIFKEQTTIKGDIPFYKIGTFGSDADSFISRELFKEYKNKYPYPNIGDILISASGSIGRTVVYNGEDAYYQDSNIVWLNHNGKIDNSFLLQFYNQVKWAGLEGSTIKRLYNKNILETNIALPKIEEQRLIGKFFELVDRSITLHQRKLNNLKLKKKALLQKLFPKNEERYPELRFPGFTDAWEQRKLGSLATVEMNKRIFKEQTTIKGDIPFYKIGTFGSDADSFISRELFKEYKNKYPYPNIGDILISASGSIGRTVVYNGEDAYYQDSNIVWLNHNGKIDNSFLLQFYNQVKWAGLEGSTIKRLYNKNILETNIALPKIEEQRLIGKFFELVDRSITLHQRKLDHLQLQKKALLQQMFV